MGITKQDQIASLHVEMLKEQIEDEAIEQQIEDEAIEQQIEDEAIEGTA